MNAGSAKPSGRRRRSTWLVSALLLLVLLAIVWAFWPIKIGWSGVTTIAGVVAQIQAWGPWAALGSIALMIAHSFLPFPSEIITLANGMVFGPLWGSVITWVGSMLGAISTFGLVRLLGRPFIYRMLSEGQVQRLSDWSSKQGGIALLFGRLIPVVSFNLLNYASALTDMSWWTYIWASGLGILPMTILLNVFGARVLTLTSSTWIWLLSIALLALCMSILWRRSKANAHKR